MPDITFTSQTLPRNWTPVLQSHHYQLSMTSQSSPWTVKFSSRDGYGLILLSQTDSPEFVLDEFLKTPTTFIDKLGVSAGIIWHPQKEEITVFRDKFGFIPLMLIHQSDKSITITSSPEVHTLVTQSYALNHTFFGRFLRNIDSDTADDVFENTERILPGEIRTFSAHTPSSESPVRIYAATHSTCYWHRRNYKPFQASYSELVENLKSCLIQAACRIPSSNPVFTLSGGLDSSGILSAYFHSKHPHEMEAFSLISNKHTSCDESYELSILENSFPIRLKRINMDTIWPLSQPELYHKYRAYGPLVSLGIESPLNIYKEIENTLGKRTIITGYGGNFIVKVRKEAMWRHLISHALHSKRDFFDLCDEISALRPYTIRTLLARTFGNIADGRIRDLLKHRSTSNKTLDNVLHHKFAAQFPAEHIDPVFFMSHCEERAWIPIGWEWELHTRAMDIIARENSLNLYDPLFDHELYDFCAQIPPQYFFKKDDYRTIYKDALQTLLPPEIIHHPKVQSFDDNILDGLRIHARDYIKNQIHNIQPHIREIIHPEALNDEFERFCQASPNRSQLLYPINDIWRALSICLWNH